MTTVLWLNSSADVKTIQKSYTQQTENKIDIVTITLSQLESCFYHDHDAHYEFLISECVFPYVLGTLAEFQPSLPLLFYTESSVQSINEGLLSWKNYASKNYDMACYLFEKSSYLKKPQSPRIVAQKIIELLENSKNQTK